MISLLKILPEKWELAKGYLRLDLEAIEAALNQRWAATFGPDNELKPDTIPGDYSVPTRYVANTGPDNTPMWDFVNLTNGVVGVLPFEHGGSNNDVDFAAGSIIFSDGTKLTEDNATFFFDDANNILRLGGAIDLQEISTPATPAADTIRLYAMDFHGNSRLIEKTPDGRELVITRDNLIIVQNTTGSPLTPGQAVYVNGATGNVPTVALARADSESTMPAIGLVYETISNNGFGRVMYVGRASFDTSAFSEGALLFVSSTVAGGLTATQPGLPNLAQRVGTVLVSGVGNGEILVSPFILRDGLATQGSVFFAGSQGRLAQDNANFFWNDTLNVLVVAKLTLAVPLEVASGGTGRNSHTAYAVLCGGTTSTAAQQSVSGVGTAGQVLTSNGAGALPSWQAASGGATTVISSTSTGTQNNFAPGISGNTFIRVNNASALTITGLASGVDGQIVTIENIGSSTIRCAHLDIGSSAANQMIWPSTRGQIIGAGGRLVLVYDGTSSKWRGQVIEPGNPISVPYNSGDFTGSGTITWTVESGDVVSFVYTQTGRVVTVVCYFGGTSVSGSGNQLILALPGGFTLSAQGTFPCTAADAGTNVPAYCFFSASGTSLAFARVDVANWGASTNQTTISASVRVLVD